ncbi:hypothetical protein MalM25_18730 [Planctomycetes bacterium MalM25]|nr:hypothetical protein MalM25_18730 [Planctomycetes bacterium MalM25]
MNLNMKTLTFAAALPAMALATALATAQTPIAYYNFNEPVGSATLADSNLNGGSAFDATYQGGGTASYGEGVLQGAWRGTGAVGDYFRTSDITELSGIIDLSISVWVNPSRDAGFDGIFTARGAETNLGNMDNPASGNWGLNHQGGNRIDARVQSGPTSSAGTDTPIDSLPIDTWTHVAYAYDSFDGEIDVYLNGVLSVNGTGQPIDTDWVTGGPWSIGNDGTTAGREFGGLIDDLAIYDTLLSPGQISTIYNNGLAGMAIDGISNPVAGDVDGNGLVEAFVPGAGNDDYDPIIDNFLDDVTGSGDTRPFGDLTNDGVVNLADFRAFKDANSPSSANGSTVPEPTSAALVALLLGGAFALRRAAKPLAAAALLVTVGFSASAEAQVVASVNQETGVITVANNGDTDVLFDGYSFQSTNQLLDPVGWSGFEENSVPGWDAFGPSNAGQFGEQLLSAGASAVVPMSPASVDLGSAFDPAAVITAQQAAGLGVEVRDLSFLFREPGNDDATTGTVEYIGETVTNNLVIKIASDGTASLENESPFTFSIDGFAITSTGGALNASWAGSPDLPLSNAAWQLGSPSVNGLGQVSLNSSESLDAAVAGVVQAGGTIDLGDIFVPGGANDLEFRFLRVGEDDGEGFLGVVEYDLSLTPLNGDYNGDGIVNAADYTVWRDNNGTNNVLPNDQTPGVVDASDYTDWADNYGATNLSPASAAAVPEPTACLLAAYGLLVAVKFRR